MKQVNILAILLAASVLLNIGFFVVFNPYEQARISDLVARTGALSAENMRLQNQINDANISLQTSSSQTQFLPVACFGISYGRA